MEMQSQDISQLLEALSKAQAIMEGAMKDSSNPFFKAKYADLSSVWEACRDPLTKNGLSVTQVMQHIDSQSFLVSILGHSSGQWIKSMIPVNPAKPDIQALGSAITYCRRYALAALVGVCPEDDDGEKAMDRQKKYDAEEVAKNYKDTPCKLNLPEGIDEKEVEEYLKLLFVLYNKKHTINQLKQMATKDMDNFIEKFISHKKKKEEEVKETVKKFDEFVETK